MGYPHTDSMYFHQRGQINFWVPLTKVYDSNTLWVESSPGLQVPVHHDISREEQGEGGVHECVGCLCQQLSSAGKCLPLIYVRLCFRDTCGQDYHPLNLNVGECARFYGNKCTHFTLANETPDTRVSLGGSERESRAAPSCFHTL